MIEKKSVSDKYYEIILDWFKEQIMTGRFREGQVIPSERELAAKFGVSRVPVREALRILEYIGIISNTPDGVTIQKTNLQFFSPQANFAVDITMETLEYLFEVRIFLESAAAYFAAKRRTEEDIDHMRDSIHQMLDLIGSKEGHTEEELVKTSHDFHFHVFSAAKNPVLANVYQNLYDLLNVSKQYTLDARYVSDSTVMDHEAILYKIEKGDAEEASKYMKFHLFRALKKLKDRADKKSNKG